MNSQTIFSDRIAVRDLRVRCAVGATAEERAEKQDLTINLTIEADLRAAAASDDLRLSIDYSHLKKEILTAIEPAAFRTMARVAECVADMALADPRAGRVHVVVEHDAGMLPARSVGVAITRERKTGGAGEPIGAERSGQ